MFGFGLINLIEKKHKNRYNLIIIYLNKIL